MKPYHIYCPFCDTRIWSIWLIAAAFVAAVLLFWMVVSVLLS
jgi:hypothetical protein